MNNLLRELKQHITTAENLRNAIPSKLELAQQEKIVVGKSKIADPAAQSILQSSISQQLGFLRKDFRSKQESALKQYEQWFAEAEATLKLCNEEYLINDFSNSKNNLELRQRIDAGLKVLREFYLDLQNDVELQQELALQSIQQQDKKKDSWKRLIKQGENQGIELKSSLRWDHKKNELNRELEIPILKTLAAFLNTKGGTLFIGVTDDNTIIGLEKDYPTLKRKDSDGFIQYLLQIIDRSLGKEINRFISIQVAELENKEVCVIETEPSDTPVFLHHNNQEYFYIRASVSSQPLNVRETLEYAKTRFKEYIGNA